jgi:hypothetical protein
MWGGVVGGAFWAFSIVRRTFRMFAWFCSRVWKWRFCNGADWGLLGGGGEGGSASSSELLSDMAFECVGW